MNASRPPLVAGIVFTLGVAVLGSAQAADLPKRKSGLWEVKTQMEGKPSNNAIQMCIDQSTDNVLQQRAQETAPCSVMDVNRSGGKTTVHSVCKHENTTITSDAVITGDFDSGYKSDIKAHYAPPLQGMADMHFIQEAKWLGPCKPGQKAGDVIMPGMGGNRGNVQEMMKDPKFQEMMKRQRQGG